MNKVMTLEEQKNICERFLKSPFGDVFVEKNWNKLNNKMIDQNIEDIPHIQFVLSMSVNHCYTKI